jgi:hypothetical protein
VSPTRLAEPSLRALNVPFALANKASRSWKITLRFFGNWSGALAAWLINHVCLLSARLARDGCDKGTKRPDEQTLLSAEPSDFLRTSCLG